MQAKIRTVVLIALMTGNLIDTQAQTGDSVVIRVGKESKVIFSIKDKRDLETLKHYDFQALMEDMVQKLEKRDTTNLSKPSSTYLKDSTHITINEPTAENWEHDRNRDEDENEDRHHRHSDRRTHHSINLDLGMNNYLQNGKFPDATNALYTVKPWGSWYVGVNSVLRTHVGGKFFVEWGGGVSWYNFKFNNEKVTLSKDSNGVIFSEDTRTYDFQKSKLTAAYLNASVVPMIDFGGNSRSSRFFDTHQSNSFRFGAGPYAGYRIDSYTKQMYHNGDKIKEHNHDNFYMNNFRYGLRAQFGYRDMNIFFNYDMNELFIDGKGPKLNAFSFGITL